jgi:hypothetical protein
MQTNCPTDKPITHVHSIYLLRPPQFRLVFYICRACTIKKMIFAPAGKRFLVPVSENGIISGIQKISHFWCRLLWTDIKKFIYSVGCLG